MGRTSGRSYKIREFQNGKNSKGDAFINYAITVPTDIAQELPRDIKYVCEVDEEGLHFRPTTLVNQPKEMPSWAQKAAQNGKPDKPKRDRPRPKPSKEPKPEPEPVPT